MNERDEQLKRGENRPDENQESVWQGWLETHRAPTVPPELLDRIVAATEVESVLVVPHSVVATQMLDFADSWIGKLVLGLSACLVGSIPYLFLLSTWKLF